MITPGHLVISRDSIREWCAAHGQDSSQVASAMIVLASRGNGIVGEVDFDVYLLRNGNRYVDPVFNQVAREIVTVPLVSLPRTQ